MRGIRDAIGLIRKDGQTGALSVTSIPERFANARP